MAKRSTTDGSEKLKVSECNYSPADLERLVDWLADVIAEQRIKEALKDERRD